MSSTISTYQASLLTSQIANNQLLFPVAGQVGGVTQVSSTRATAATYESTYVAPQSAVSSVAAAEDATNDTTTGPAASESASSTTTSAASTSSPASDGYAGESVLSGSSATAAAPATSAENQYQQAYDNGLVTNDETLLAPIVGPYGVGTASDGIGISVDSLA